MEDINREKLNVYKTYNIDVILSMSSKSDEELFKSIKEIKDVNGGLSGYQALLKNLHALRDENDQYARNMKKIIEEDYRKDK